MRGQPLLAIKTVGKTALALHYSLYTGTAQAPPRADRRPSNQSWSWAAWRLTGAMGARVAAGAGSSVPVRRRTLRRRHGSEAGTAQAPWRPARFGSDESLFGFAGSRFSAAALWPRCRRE